MFVPVVAYDPDLFADFVFVLSQIETSADSQPIQTLTAEKTAGTKPQRVSSAAQLQLAVFLYSQTARQRVAADNQIVLQPAGQSQVQSKFGSQTFQSNPPAPALSGTMVGGSFDTTAIIETMYDNIIFRVTVPSFDMSDTKLAHKSVAPVVSQ